MLLNFLIAILVIYAILPYLKYVVPAAYHNKINAIHNKIHEYRKKSVKFLLIPIILFLLASTLPTFRNYFNFVNTNEKVFIMMLLAVIFATGKRRVG